MRKILLILLLLLINGCVSKANYSSPKDECPTFEECTFVESPTQEEYIQQQYCIQKLLRAKNLCLQLYEEAWDKSR